jgi:hypothetical protein
MFILFSRKCGQYCPNLKIIVHTFWAHLNVIQMLVVILVVGTCGLLRWLFAHVGFYGCYEFEFWVK